MRLRVQCVCVGLPLSRGVCLCLCVCVCVAQLPRGVWSRCAYASFTHSTRAHCLPCWGCIQPHVVSIGVFSLGAHSDIWAPCSVRFIVEKESVLGICVCVWVWGRLCVRFVFPSSLFVHIWLETHQHAVFMSLGMDMQVITARIILEIVILGCQRRSDGVGSERVLKQPWHKGFFV